MKFSTIYSLLFLVVFAGCYAPSDSNFHEVDIPAPPTASLDLLELEGDTLSFANYLSINFKVETESDKYYRSELVIDSTVVKTYSDTDIYYRIEQEDYETGIHEIQLVSYFRTGSGSLAEQLNAEYYIATKNWYFEVDNDPCTPVAISNWEVTPAGLIINWEKYDRPNFYSYSLRRQRVGNTSQYSIDSVGIVRDIETTHIIVDDILGGEYEYRIDLSCYMSDQRTFTGEWTTIEAGGINLTYKDGSFGNLTAIWTKPPIETNFKRYEVFRELDDYSTGWSFLNVNEIEDTTYTLPIYLGSTISYRIRAYSQSNNSYFSNWITYSQKDRFTEFPVDAELFMVDGNSNLFYTSGANIYEISKSTGEKLSTKSFYQHPILTDQYIYDIDTYSSSNNPAIVRFSKTDYSETDRIYSNQLFSDGSIIISVLPSYNSTKVLVKTTTQNGNSPTVHYVDYSTKTILKSISLSDIDDNIAISPNGKYFIQNYRFYTFQGENNIHEQRTEPEWGSFTFDAYRNDIYYGLDRASSCLVRTVSINDMNVENYYRVRETCNNVFFNKFEGVYTVVTPYNVYLLDLIKDNYQSIGLASRFEDDSYYYFDNAIYSSNGYTIDAVIRD